MQMKCALRKQSCLFSRSICYGRLISEIYENRYNGRVWKEREKKQHRQRQRRRCRRSHMEASQWPQVLIACKCVSLCQICSNQLMFFAFVLQQMNTMNRAENACIQFGYFSRHHSLAYGLLNGFFSLLIVQFTLQTACDMKISSTSRSSSSNIIIIIYLASKCDSVLPVSFNFFSYPKNSD